MHRISALFLPLVLLFAVFGGAGEARAQSASVNAAVKVNIKKPLVITSLQPMDLGTIIMTTAPGPHTVRLSRAGILTCPAALTCNGAVQAASYNITGSHKQTVTIQAPDFDMVNAVTGAAIRFYPDAPASIALPNSGNKGTDFSVGGSMTIPVGAEGTYEGTITITADYQ